MPVRYRKRFWTWAAESGTPTGAFGPFAADLGPFWLSSLFRFEKFAPSCVGRHARVVTSRVARGADHELTRILGSFKPTPSAAPLPRGEIGARQPLPAVYWVGWVLPFPSSECPLREETKGNPFGGTMWRASKGVGGTGAVPGDGWVERGLEPGEKEALWRWSTAGNESCAL